MDYWPPKTEKQGPFLCPPGPCPCGEFLQCGHSRAQNRGHYSGLFFSSGPASRRFLATLVSTFWSTPAGFSGACRCGVGGHERRSLQNDPTRTPRDAATVELTPDCNRKEDRGKAWPQQRLPKNGGRLADQTVVRFAGMASQKATSTISASSERTRGNYNGVLKFTLCSSGSCGQGARCDLAVASSTRNGNFLAGGTWGSKCVDRQWGDLRELGAELGAA